MNEDKTGLENLSDDELKKLNEVGKVADIKNARTVEEVMSMMSRHHRRKAEAILRAKPIKKKNRRKKR